MSDRTGMDSDGAEGLCRSAAAYVLGALPADQRRTFEAHLDDCADCRRTVRELAGIPGLLSRVSPDDLADAAPPPPDTLLPGALGALRRRRRRRRAGLVAAAAAVLVVGIGAAVLTTHDDGGQNMTSLVAGAPITATADLTSEPGGTRVDMTCVYDGATPGDLPAYVLVVTDRDGADHQIATWKVGPDGVSRVVGSVDLPPAQISRVEVRTAAGKAILRLNR